MRRFYCQQPITGPEVLLAGPEAHHLLHVDRIEPGETVILFDGVSGEYLARLVEASADSARLEVVERIQPDRLAGVEVVLMTAVPKGGRMDVIVQMTCELGLAKIVPVVTSRSVVNPGQGKIEHWRRIVVESCKQSGRNTLMSVEEPVRFAEALGLATPDALKLLLSTTTDARPIAEPLRARPQKIALLVGPEGGFTEAECDEARRAGFVPVSLGSATLRIETAAVCAVALVLAGSPGN